MKIQISPIRIVPDALTVWSEHGPDVDMVMDVKNLTFKPGSIDEIYSFHVLEHLFTTEIPQALANWRSVLKTGGDVYVIADDWEFISRAFVGGEILIDFLNEKFSYPTKITRDNLVAELKSAGFVEGDIRIWYADVPDKIKKMEHEIIIVSKKI